MTRNPKVVKVEPKPSDDEKAARILDSVSVTRPTDVLCTLEDIGEKVDGIIKIIWIMIALWGAVVALGILLAVHGAS